MYGTLIGYTVAAEGRSRMVEKGVGKYGKNGLTACNKGWGIYT